MLNVDCLKRRLRKKPQSGSCWIKVPKFDENLVELALLSMKIGAKTLIWDPDHGQSHGAPFLHVATIIIADEPVCDEKVKGKKEDKSDVRE